MIVRDPDGSFTREGHRAGSLGAQTYSQSSELRTTAAIMVLYQLPGTNAAKAAEGVHKLMAEAKQRFRRYGLRRLARQDAVRHGRYSEILKTLFEALALVVLVVFIFLQTWRATRSALCGSSVVDWNVCAVPPCSDFDQHAFAFRTCARHWACG
jgi:hypothetical protein